MIALLIALGVSGAVAVILLVTPWLRRSLTRAATGPRWRRDAVPVSGGIAMAVGFTLAVLVAGRGEPGAGAVVTASTLFLAIGVTDDLHPLSPRAKLLVQSIGALLLAAGGVRAEMAGGIVVEVVAGAAWVVLVVNAVNLLDGMDGLAGGVCLVAGGTVLAWNAPDPLAAAFVGAVAGFLPLNVHRARMFMGNGGSHWMGMVLAGLTLLDGGRAGGDAAVAAWAVVAVPVVLLAVPLFDTAFVTVERLRSRRPVTVGGTDHSSHRLVAAGLGEGRAVALLWGLGLAAAAVASLIRIGPGVFAAGGGALTLVLVLGGVRLSRVAPMAEADHRRPRAAGG